MLAILECCCWVPSVIDQLVSIGRFMVRLFAWALGPEKVASTLRWLESHGIKPDERDP